MNFKINKIVDSQAKIISTELFLPKNIRVEG